MIKKRDGHVTYTLESPCKGSIMRGAGAHTVAEAIGKARAYMRFACIPRVMVTVLDSCGLVVHQESFTNERMAKTY